MVTLYIIGAGCSRNYDQSNSPVPGLKPPLNKDFFKMAKKVIDYYDLNFMYSPILGLDHLVKDINHLCGRYSHTGRYNSKVLNDERLNLENVMNFYHLQELILEQDFQFYFAATRRSSVLNDLLAYTISESIGGPICNKHVRLAKKIQKGDFIWNFNYDFLLDSALYAQNKFADSGYAIRFDYSLVDDKWRKLDDNASPITMLKLHGSLNWLRCTSCGCFLLISCSKEIEKVWKKVRDARSSWGDASIVCPKCDSERNLLPLERIIIPPSLAKSYDVLKYVSYGDLQIDLGT